MLNDASDYRFLNVSGISGIITGHPMPLRTGASARTVRGEDMAFLLEMALERQSPGTLRYVRYTSATASELSQPGIMTGFSQAITNESALLDRRLDGTLAGNIAASMDAANWNYCTSDLSLLSNQVVALGRTSSTSGQAIMGMFLAKLQSPKTTLAKQGRTLYCSWISAAMGALNACGTLPLRPEFGHLIMHFTYPDQDEDITPTNLSLNTGDAIVYRYRGSSGAWRSTTDVELDGDLGIYVSLSGNGSTLGTCTMYAIVGVVDGSGTDAYAVNFGAMTDEGTSTVGGVAYARRGTPTGVVRRGSALAALVGMPLSDESRKLYLFGVTVLASFNFKSGY